MFRTIELDARESQSSQTLRYGFGQTPVGPALIGWNERTVWYLALAAQDRTQSLQNLREQGIAQALVQDGSGAAQLLSEIFDSPGSSEIIIAMQGTPFQRKVWQELLKIKRAEQISYGEIAARLGLSGAARAVGSAVGANRIAYLIPCHRVARKSGDSARFRWGLQVKRDLCQWEADVTCV